MHVVSPREIYFFFAICSFHAPFTRNTVGRAEADIWLFYITNLMESLSHSRSSSHFMEPEGSLQYSQDPATGA
jgi:hypothetical protein